MRRLAALALPVLLLAACGSNDGPGSGDLRVVATTTQLGDFAQVVGGERVAVTRLLAPNVDPHEYEPRPSDVRAVGDARVVLTSGMGLDDWAGGLVERARVDARPVDVGAAVPVVREGEDHGHAEEEAHAGEEEEHGGEADPHWWHDPRNARAAVERIRDELVRVDPAGAETYRRNASAYLARLERLDAGIRSCVGSVPARERKIVTDHDAFGYFTERYGIDVVGTVIPSQTTEGQASARDVAELADVIEREDVKAIYPEASLDPAVARALADQTGTTAEYTLFSDTLGAKGSRGATYLTMMEANADAIVRGFTAGSRGCPIRT